MNQVAQHIESLQFWKGERRASGNRFIALVGNPDPAVEDELKSTDALVRQADQEIERLKNLIQEDLRKALGVSINELCALVHT